MSEVILVNQSCRETLRRLDQYVDKQLTDAEVRELVTHLEGCSSCYQELELRRRLRARLKSAVSSSPSPYLQTKVLASVRSAADVQRGIWSGWRREIAG